MSGHYRILIQPMVENGCGYTLVEGQSIELVANQNEMNQIACAVMPLNIDLTQFIKR